MFARHHDPAEAASDAPPGRRPNPHGRSAFSLFEAVLIIVILAVCVAIVLPRYLAYRNDSRSSRMVRSLHALAAAEESFRASHGAYSSNAAALAVPLDPGSHLEILSADSTGWSARVRRDDPPATCAVFSGLAAPVPPATTKDVIRCTP